MNDATNQSSRSLQARYRKLTLKLQYLYAELDEAAEVFVEAKIQFARAYQESCAKFSEDEKKKIDAGEKNCALPPQIEPPKMEADKKEVKKLFREIASETHPDKLDHMADEEQEFRTGMFEKAKQACAELNWYELSKLAEELNIKIPSLSETQISMLEGTIGYVSKQIDMMHNTYAWQWYQHDPQDAREKFMIQYMQSLIRS